MTEVWFRNPGDYVREVVEVGAKNVIWDVNYLRKKHIDPIKYLGIHYGPAFPFRTLVVTDAGCQEYGPDSENFKPKAVYPVWSFGDDLATLEECMENPVGEDEEICNLSGVAKHDLPVYGQEHRVIIANIPPVNLTPTRSFLRVLKELQEDYPECILHLHGLYSFRVSFGMGFRSSDVEPRTIAQKGGVFLPSGKNVAYEKTRDTPHLVTMLGMQCSDLSVPRNRCMYTIRSAMWAGEHFMEQENSIRTTPPRGVPPRLGDRNSGQSPLPRGVKVKEGDKELCDTCSLSNVCRSYRVGSVCTVNKSETKSLATMFQTRDADTILDGIATILAKQTERTERAVQNEEAIGDVNPEVTKMLKDLMADATKYVKLVDPRRFSTATVVIPEPPLIGGKQAVDPRRLVAQFVKELEGRGIPREAITDGMIKMFLDQNGDPNIIEHMALTAGEANE